MGEAEKILEYIILEKPKELKNMGRFLEKSKVEDYKKVIALKDKPIVNFITN